jgi:hypothetical protein
VRGEERIDKAIAERTAFAYNGIQGVRGEENSETYPEAVMDKIARLVVALAAITSLLALTVSANGSGANPDPGRTGAANDGGTSGPGGNGNGSTESGSGCSK